MYVCIQAQVEVIGSIQSVFTHKVLDLRCFVVNFKGDWKYIYQLFCMERYATKEEASATSRSAACAMYVG